MAAQLLIANGNLVDGPGAAMCPGVSVLLEGDRIAGVGPEAEHFVDPSRRDRLHSHAGAYRRPYTHHARRTPEQRRAVFTPRSGRLRHSRRMAGIPGRPGELSVWTEDELRVVRDTAHELGIPVTGHCRTARSTRDCLRAGMDIILHASFLGEGTGAQHIGSESKELLDLYEETLALLTEKKTPVVPTWTFLGNLSEFGHKVGARPTAMDLFRDEIQTAADILRRAYDAGVPFLCGSETGFSITPVGQWHAREMELFVKYLGLSPLEAITCGTRNGAIVMGMEGRVGTLEVDRLADVLVVNGDPLNDIRILGDRSRFKAVISRGVPVNLERPYPKRRVLGEEKVSQYSNQPLTWDLVNS